MLLPPATSVYAATLCLACPPRTHPFTARWDVLLRLTFRVCVYVFSFFPFARGCLFRGCFSNLSSAGAGSSLYYFYVGFVLSYVFNTSVLCNALQQMSLKIRLAHSFLGRSWCEVRVRHRRRSRYTSIALYFFESKCCHETVLRPN